MFVDHQYPAQKPLSISNGFGSAKEQRAFQYFQERTNIRLSGFYECEFWNRIILQAAHVDPGIRHAVVALASLDEEFQRSGEADSMQDDFALKQYNLAIRQHLDRIGNLCNAIGSLDNYLASSMVFICIEILQGHYTSAISLVKGAVKLFYESNFDCLRTSAWPLEVFESILARLQAMAVGLVGVSARGSTVPPCIAAATYSGIPDKFSSVTEARNCLELYVHIHSLSGPADAAHAHGQDFDKKLGVFSDVLPRWSSAFDGFLESVGADTSARDQRAIAILKIRRIKMSISIDIAHRARAIVHDAKTLRDQYTASYFEDQMLWDEYNDDYEKVIELAQEVARRTPNAPIFIGQQSYLFTLDFGIVAPLYDLARVCRDPIIRRKAIELLRSNPCRDGLWDGQLAARAAKLQMELEESAVPEVKTAADIPTWARISCVVPSFRPGDRYAVVQFTRQHAAAAAGHPRSFQHCFEW